MLSQPKLTPEQIASFKRDGFVLVRNAFSKSEVAEISTWLNEMLARPEEPGKHWVFWEESRKAPGKKIVSRMEKLSPFHGGFKSLTETLAGPTSQLLGEPSMLFKEKVNFKFPGAAGFTPHQDSQAGWEKYAKYFISVMVCIDEATIDNGCLQMVAGYQRKGLYREWEPLTDEDMKGMDFVPVPTKPGDIAFFDSYAPHASDPNMTDTTRRLYFATYNAASEGDHLEAYYADKRKTYPPDIEREQGKEYRFKV
jgi:hypothetical protein